MNSGPHADVDRIVSATGRAGRVFRREITYGIGFILTAFTLLLYWPTVGYDFVIADDYQYVCQNPHVLKGLSWDGIQGAFWSMYATNWHPLTWISHMMDCSLYGLFPGGHHLTNVLFHTANSLLLFLWLKRATGKLLPSAFVAALFAWHPLHVESVAWVCERKDVLSTFFLMFTLMAYSYYVERPTRGRFFLALALFLCGLMAKPMLVTLPFLLLLLDYWPLHRFETVHDRSELLKRAFNLAIEKIPFFFLSFLGCVMTMVAQSANGAVKEMGEFSLSRRLANSLSSYLLYLGKGIWPVHLAIMYPLPATPQWGWAVAGLLLILVVTGLAVWRCRQFPWLMVGWLWFLGTLVPVIGLVQVGAQSMADRYTYIPFIGLFIMLAWAVDAWLRRRPSAGRVALPISFVILAACFFLTRIQLGYWCNSAEVFSHALSLTPHNPFSDNNLSYSLAQQKRGPDAVPRLKTILSSAEEIKNVRAKMVDDTASVGLHDDAQIQLSEALNYDPNSAPLHNNLGIVLAEQGKPDEAIEEFQKAMQCDPKSAWAYFNASVVLKQKGQVKEAEANYLKAVALRASHERKRMEQEKTEETGKVKAGE